MVKPKIACYITGGWTECGYMTHFLEKINSSYDYRQRFPRKNIGKKGKSRKYFKVDGTTGADLIKWIYDDIRNHKEELEKYSAILIEDDMDDQFFLPSKKERDYDLIEKRKQEVASEIRKMMQKPELPVFFFYALPEIEAWFIADWDEAFGKEYANVLSEMNLYFSTTFRKYVAKEVLTDQFSFPNVENFGYINSEYQKLSDRLIAAFQEYSYASEGYKNNEIYNARINELIKSNKITYSKKREGINILQRIAPEKIALVCTHYFAKVYTELKDFNHDIVSA